MTFKHPLSTNVSLIEHNIEHNKVTKPALYHEVLHKVSEEMSNEGFSHITPTRLSVVSTSLINDGSVNPSSVNPGSFNHSAITNSLNDSADIQANFVGLTKALKDDAQVMVKWSLVPIAMTHACTLSTALKKLTAIQESEKLSKTSLKVIEINRHDKRRIQVFNQQWQLTICVMPYYELGSLKEYLKAHSLTQAQTLQLISAVAQGLSNLHRLSWIHGDIKPSNILVSHCAHCMSSSVPSALSDVLNGRLNIDVNVCLNDFGCAMPIEAPKSANEGRANNQDNNQNSSNQNNSNQNNSNQINIKQNYENHTAFYRAKEDAKALQGTPAYLAPECWQQNTMSRQSDVYAFGILMYEILMQQRPYAIRVAKKKHTTDTSTLWALAHCQTPIPLLADKWQLLQPLLDKLLAKRLCNRYKSIEQFITEFDEVLMKAGFQDKP